MNTDIRLCRFGLYCVALVGLALASGSSSAQASRTSATVTRVALVGSDSSLGLQIDATIPVATDSQILTGPDRIVIDFPGALPGRQLHGFAVKQGGIRAVRVGLFETNPPKTRVVIDLDHPTPYQLLPSGNMVLVKLGAPPSPLSVAPKPASATVIPPAEPPPLQVTYINHLLQVNARNASLADVLNQIRQRTGAEIAIPAGADQERVVANVGPGPAKEVLASLLNGSRFNFVLVGAAQDQTVLHSVILIPKANAGVQEFFDATQPAVPPAQPPAPAMPQASMPQRVGAAIPVQGEGSVAPAPDPPPDPGQPAATQVPEAPIPDQAQPQPVLNTPAPATTPEGNRPWSEPPPSTPQPD